MNVLRKILIVPLFISLFACANPEIKNDSRVVEIKVDKNGYHPSIVTVPKEAESVTLRFKRVTDNTCAREVIYEEQAINEKLPLNKPVNVTFDLRNDNTVTYGCHMNKMYKGVILKK